MRITSSNRRSCWSRPKLRFWRTVSSGRRNVAGVFGSRARLKRTGSVPLEEHGQVVGAETAGLGFAQQPAVGRFLDPGGSVVLHPPGAALVIG